MDGIQNGIFGGEPGLQPSTSRNSSLSTGEEAGEPASRHVSFTQTSTELLPEPKNATSAIEEESGQPRVSRRFYRRPKSQFSLLKGPSHGLSSSKVVMLIAAFAVLYFLKLYLQRCLFPQLAPSSSAGSISPSSLQTSRALLSPASTQSPGPHTVGSTNSRRLSQGDEPPSAPICGDNDTGDEAGVQEGEKKNGQKKKQRAKAPRAKRGQPKAEDPEDESEGVPKKKSRRGAPRAKPQAEPSEEEHEQEEEMLGALGGLAKGDTIPTESDLAALLENQPLQNFDSVFHQHLASLHASSGRVSMEMEYNCICCYSVAWSCLYALHLTISEPCMFGSDAHFLCCYSFALNVKDATTAFRIHIAKRIFHVSLSN
uniref:Uncharacterized protein n=1 Tax=Neospora caninum (strain Liverpool) TaxID=572307 RepID=A0A0F7U6V6_NEOCL|nr:TPA: hypothetical protein BN1204_013405 [Neospora caninum Liverpool]